ncbi:hypothetical protein GCM10011506_06590 [Marivirga lumbricoides]|uniref:Tetratricopeptide repeat protein n=1 Tax=Marivirga lumbricoides TaxID=1046115 RepID=A0ABQ1LH38_9BACT|nr:hypothetical protein GCM10011506_06590 [Marivirga lumbricoides]
MTQEFIQCLSEAKECYKELKKAKMHAELKKASTYYQQVREEAAADDLALYHQLHIRFYLWQDGQKDVDNRANMVFQHLSELEQLDKATAKEYELATSLYAQASFDVFENAFRLYPHNAVIKTNLAKYYVHNGQIAEAKKCLKHAFEEAPFDLSILIEEHEIAGAELAKITDFEADHVPPEAFEEVLKLSHEAHKADFCLALLEKEEAKDHFTEEARIHLECINLCRSDDWQSALDKWPYIYDEETIESPIGKVAYAEILTMTGEYEEITQLLEDFPAYSAPRVPNSIKELMEHETTSIPASVYAQMHYVHANALRGLSLHDGALDQHEKSLGILPDNALAIIGKVRAHFDLEEYSDSLTLLNEAFASGLDQKTYYREFAEMYFALGDWKNVIKVLNAFHQNEMVTSRSAYLMGLALYFLRHTQEALQWLTKTITEFSETYNTRQALYYRALLYRSLFYFNEAIKDINQLVPLCSVNSREYWDAMLLMADMAYQVGAFDRSYEYLAHIHSHHPLSGIYLLYLQLLIHDGHHKQSKIEVPEGIELLSEKSIISAPKDALDHLINAKVLSIMNKYAEAAEAFTQVAELGFKPGTHYGQAFHHAFEAKDFDKVVELYDKVIQHAPKLFDDVYGARWAFSLYKLERYDEAIAAYKEILYDYPVIAEDLDSSIKWTSVMFEAHRKKGYYEDALKYLSTKCSQKQESTYYDLRALEEIAANQKEYSELSHLGTLLIMDYSEMELSQKELGKLNRLRNKIKEEVFYP